MTLAAAGTRTLWYATRGTGVVSLLLLTAVVAIGVATVSGARAPRWPRFVVARLHRNLTLVALLFIAVHVVTTVLDGFAPIGLKDAVIPFTSAYRPIWLGLGAVAFDLLLALTLTSLLRARIGVRAWRTFHWLAYASWPVALVHALGTGSDVRVGWLQVLAAGSLASVLTAVVYRLATAPAASRLRTAAAAAAIAVPLGIGLWYASGPGERGWARRAGTPQRLLPSSTVVRVASAQARARDIALPPEPFTRTFTGTLSQARPDANGLVLVSIRGRTARPDAGLLWIRLQGQPVLGGGVSMTASGASFGPPTSPQEYTGSIVGLQGTRVLVRLRGAAQSIDLLLDLHVQPGTTAVSGLVHVQAATEGSG